MILGFDLNVYAIVFVQTLHFMYILELIYVIVVKSIFSGALEKNDFLFPHGPGSCLDSAGLLGQHSST